MNRTGLRRTPFFATSGLDRLSALGLAGLMLLPVLIGGLLVLALWNPTTNLHRITAAIVNDDVPVTVNGQTIPLGRQFAGALINSGQPAPTSSPAPTPQPSASSTSTTAAGSSATAVPSTASSTPAPTATAPADVLISTTDPGASNFTWILTNDADAAAGLASGAYDAVLTIPSNFSAAATSLSGPAAQATTATVNVETSPAAAYIDPALAQTLTTVATASLSRELTSSYLSNLLLGFTTINTQIGQAATGAASVSSGAASVSSGASQLASGTASLQSGLQALSSGADSLSSGLDSLSGASASLPSKTSTLAGGSAQVADGADSIASAISQATSQFAQVVATICAAPGPGTACTQAQDALAQMKAANSQIAAFAGGANQVASGNAALASAMPALVDGIDQSASGAAQLATGAAQASSGASSLNDGANSLAGGASQVNDGAAQLSSGLASAVSQIPTYSDSDRATLSSVGSQPVVAEQAPPNSLQTVPIFAIVALWIGAIVTNLARKTVPTRELMSSASSVSIALRSTFTVAVVGAIRGLLVAGAVQLGLNLPLGEWLCFAGVCALAGVTFGVVNQALGALLGGAGRLIAALVGVIALAVGLSSTVPPGFRTIAGVLPTTPAMSMLRGAATGDALTAWGGLAVCVLFSLFGLAFVFAAIASRRTVRARTLVLPARTIEGSAG